MYVQCCNSVVDLSGGCLGNLNYSASGFSRTLKPDAASLFLKYPLHYVVLIIVAPNDHLI